MEALNKIKIKVRILSQKGQIIISMINAAVIKSHAKHLQRYDVNLLMHMPV